MPAGCCSAEEGERTVCASDAYAAARSFGGRAVAWSMRSPRPTTQRFAGRFCGDLFTETIGRGVVRIHLEVEHLRNSDLCRRSSSRRCCGGSGCGCRRRSGRVQRSVVAGCCTPRRSVSGAAVGLLPVGQTRAAPGNDRERPGISVEWQVRRDSTQQRAGMTYRREEWKVC